MNRLPCTNAFTDFTSTFDVPTRCDSPRLFTPTGFVSCRQLRPGHWVKTAFGQTGVVLQSSNRDAICEIRFAHRTLVMPHAHLDMGDSLGRGVKRWWWPLLPKWARDRVCPFSKPIHKRQ